MNQTFEETEMRSLKRIVIALLLVTLAGTASFAKTRKKHVTFVDNVLVNGTLVNAGNYLVEFDEMANELSVVKNGKVVAKTAAHAEPRDSKSNDTRVRRRGMGDSSQLVSITFSGSKTDVVVDQAGMQAGGNN